MQAHLTQQRLTEILSYNEEDGIFVYRKPRGNLAAGDRAGTVHRHGYIRIMVDGRTYEAHRLAVLYVTGEWPSDDVDHINMVRDDNRWINLRLATRTQNRANTRVRSDNRVGLKGVHLHRNNRWRACVHILGRRTDLGVFTCPAAAHFSYLVAADKLFGSFARG